MSAKQRLLFLITQFDTGGVQHQLWLRLKHLDRSRYDCRVAVLTRGQSHLLDRVRALGVAVDFLDVDAATSLWQRVARIREYINHVRPDVVDTLLLWDNTYGTMAAALAGVPLIVAELQSMGDMRTGVSRGERWLEAAARRVFCDHIVCCCDAVMASYAQSFPGLRRKATTIHDAIAADGPAVAQADARRRLGLPADRPIVGTLGRLHEVKDHDTWLRTARRIANIRPDVLFVVGGDGALKAQLLERRAQLGLEDAVRFMGEVTEPETFHAAIDIFLLTSKTEGLPIVVLEAMAAGRPIVATRVGGVAEAMRDGVHGRLCNAGDDRALAEAVTSLIDDAELRRNCGALAQRDVAAFDIRRAVEQWDRIYAMTGRRRFVGRQVAPLPLPRQRRDVPWPASSARVLMFRLCPMPRFLRLLDEVKRRYPDAMVDVVCQSGAVQTLEAAGAHAAPYGDGPFRLAQAWRLARRLRSAQYDTVLLPYNVPSRAGYAAAELCALWAGRGHALATAAWSDTPATLWALSSGEFADHYVSSNHVLANVLRSAWLLVSSLRSMRPSLMPPQESRGDA